MLEIVEWTSGRGVLCQEIMTELSDWFSEPEVIAACADVADSLPMFACMDKDAVAGFVMLRPHLPDAMEILVIGTRQAYQRRGVGRRLLTASESFARKSGCKLLTVKTLAPRGRDEPHYDATRAFYENNGFLRAEVLTALWDEGSPCLFLVRPLDGQQ
ncbi:GNAT family N-acetyltransferase [Allorhizobium taibaishanense]|uniref:GNAT family N-acetyltransferase n=2 Tax=Allorhizobium taibaishanense TaxID=887144 RepID=A0A1Q9A682_9HYPH|nr:GNAT family N-acetyltransferase [Allorhizobium taibaishanense]OLP50102.1 GNAT family N-acetyltransferase [Allorhizobium taibaishanense]